MGLRNHVLAVVKDLDPATPDAAALHGGNGLGVLKVAARRTLADMDDSERFAHRRHLAQRHGGSHPIWSAIIGRRAIQ